MKLAQLAFTFILFGILKFMIVTSLGTSTESYTSNSFDVPAFPNVVICFDGDGQSGCDATFYHFQSAGCDLFDFSCSSVAQATQNAAIALINVGVALYIAILFLIKLLIYVVLLIVFVASLLFSTIPDAPWYVNAIMITPLLLMFGLIIFKLFRKGSDSA